ncbi:general stress protein [Sporosarcina thermotolerans]|uniref:General stress protein n=1 Tax=Sporosarcina thermotolerans TaxID=633404 RepID=A0AAW9A6X0_9BACL|nr:general stress protein [Sporosarcina thermotolerans]MDW0116055.1 general stress protein [Sporosarcina thermotolerans]WHT48027.1 general stress protein [Sporosarcina thermotolerans]
MRKTFIGSFPNQERLIYKIQELLDKGVEEQDLYIVMKDEKAVDELRRHATLSDPDSPFNLFNRFMGFLAGEKNVRSMLHDSGFTDGEAKKYFHAVQEGALLLYMNGKFEKARNVDRPLIENGYEGYELIPLDESEAGLEN